MVVSVIRIRSASFSRSDVAEHVVGDRVEGDGNRFGVKKAFADEMVKDVSLFVKDRISQRCKVVERS